jgi:dolichyl-phosphate-mannose--protein O-mannosyl transferase
MGDHLSFGYISVPPMMAFLAFVIKNIFGYSVFGIRLIPALSGAASIYVIAKIIRQLGGSTLVLIIASSAFLLSGPSTEMSRTSTFPKVFDVIIRNSVSVGHLPSLSL